MTDPELAPAAHPPGGRVHVKRKNTQKQKFYGLPTQQGRLLDVVPLLMYDDDGSFYYAHTGIENKKWGGEEKRLHGQRRHLVGSQSRPINKRSVRSPVEWKLMRTVCINRAGPEYTHATNCADIDS